MNNTEIREAIFRANVRYWQVAAVLGIHEGSLSRILRRELPSEEKEKIIAAINLAKEMK